MFTGTQIRGARAMLGWSAKDLADRAHVGLSTVLRIEHSGDEARGNAKSLERIEAAFRANGIDFVQNTDTIGITLKAGCISIASRH